jgi:hypothetical protein
MVTNDYESVLNQQLLGVRDGIFELEGNYLNEESEQASYYPFVAGESEIIEGLNCGEEWCELQEQVKEKVGTGEREIVLPKLERGQQAVVTGRAWLSKEGAIEVVFEPQVQLQVGELIYDLPKLQNLHLENLAIQEKVILDLGDNKPYLLKQNEVVNFALELTIGEALRVKVVDATGIENVNEEVVVNKNLMREYEFPATIWEKILDPPEIKIGATERLVARWTGVSFDLQLDSEEEINCDVGERGVVKKERVSGGISYQAERFGSLCDDYSLKELSSLNDYLVQTVVEHKRGQGLQFSVVDEMTKRLVTSQTLDTKREIQYFYLPHLEIWNNQQQNLFFYLVNKSYGQVSENVIKKIRWWSYPIAYLSRIKVRGGEEETEGGIAYFVRNVEGGRGDYYRLWLERMNEGERKEAVIVLRRGWDKNWRARVKEQNGWRTLEEHQRFNGWANAWKLKGVEGKIEEVEIEYWPQQLVLVGIGLMVGEVLIMGINFGRERWQKKRLRLKFRAQRR